MSKTGKCQDLDVSLENLVILGLKIERSELIEELCKALSEIARLEDKVEKWKD
jgi:hypothetical protein